MPVVATVSGGAEEVIDDGTTGILVERQNPHELAEAIASLVTSPERPTCMGKTGRERVEQLFDLSKQSAQFEAVLERVANSHKRS